MTLTIPNVGDTIYASTINQLVNVLQQPPGGQEVRTYHLAGNSYQAGVVIQDYVISRSRGTVPVSVSIDRSGETLLNLNTPVTGNLSSAGVQVFATSSAVATTCVVGGTVTFQY